MGLRRKIGPRASAACAAVVLACGIVAGCSASGSEEARLQEPAERADLGLITSLPIYWSEAPSFEDALSQETEAHWARTVMESDYALKPVDLISEETLSGLERLAIIQPRGLTPGENVALDDWVRGGGRLLLVLDPMLTEHSHFAIGDARRPADVALVPPLLARWGLEMRFEESQPERPRSVDFAGVALPLHLAGTLVSTGDMAQAQCETGSAGAVASCSVGNGSALLLADAALFEHEREGGADTLRSIMKSAFGDKRIR